jgi:hypothetical protein
MLVGTCFDMDTKMSLDLGSEDHDIYQILSLLISPHVVCLEEGDKPIQRVLVVQPHLLKRPT